MSLHKADFVHPKAIIAPVKANSLPVKAIIASASGLFALTFTHSVNTIANFDSTFTNSVDTMADFDYTFTHFSDTMADID